MKNKLEVLAICSVFIASIILLITIVYAQSIDYSVPKPNYYGLALMNIIPNSYPCNINQASLYESTGVAREYLGTKYLILVNKFTGDTCPIKI